VRHLNLPSTPNVPMTQANREHSKKRDRIDISNVVQFDEVQPVLAAAVLRNIFNRFSVVQCQRQQERRDVKLSVLIVMLKFERSISYGSGKLSMTIKTLKILFLLTPHCRFQVRNPPRRSDVFGLTQTKNE